MSKTEVVTMVDVKKLEDAFLEALNAGVEAMRKAGNALVRLMIADEEAIGRLVEKGIPRATLMTLARIGRGELLPELAFKPAMGRLPIDEQRKVCGGAVAAVVIRDGKTDTIQVDLRNADHAMVDQLLAHDHIRTLPEQVQYIETRRKPMMVKQAAIEGVPWRVRGGKIDILTPINGLTRGDLLNMMRAIGGGK